ncbi:hypothetical protein GCM10010971_00160 [Silvimonas amylolytica]|uniref:Uncharacterized protein n=1 Tax=Silvimonas amylolytica TaxID=449663 RepID=A0ABQ2PFL3_9NEIS|nr:hypothetical protein GCM10010971_00160 [Silvimonas amylolytica]
MHQSQYFGTSCHGLRASDHDFDIKKAAWNVIKATWHDQPNLPQPNGIYDPDDRDAGA